ncbi:MAG: acyl-CoA dehydrogenase family protein [Chloroflexota bacterium]
MDYLLTDTQAALQKMAREYATNVMRPRSLELDRKEDPRECFSWDVIEEGSKLGLRTLVVSEKNGGGGVDLVSMCLVSMELGYGDLGTASCFNQCWWLSRILDRLTTEDQRERFLKPFVENHRFLLARAVTEPNAGTDNDFYDAVGAGIAMTAIPDGDHYVLNGTKAFITNAGVAGLYVVSARTDPAAAASRGTTIFLVPADSPGLTVGKFLSKPGRRCALNAELYFQNVRVPRENILGEVNRPPAQVAGLARMMLPGSMCLGTARAAYEMALEHSRERVQGGRPIKEHQAIKMMLGEMWILLETGRAVALRGAQMIEAGADAKYSEWIKYVCVEHSFKVCEIAGEIYGGYFYSREHPVEKFYRDALAYRHPSPVHIARMKIADRL